MSPDALLADLQQRGLTIRAEGNRLIVTPRNALTDELRDLLREAKPALLSLLHGYTPELERRLQAMARRWRYSDVELAEVLALARSNPSAWARAVTLDERREQEFRDRGLLDA